MRKRNNPSATRAPDPDPTGNDPTANDPVAGPRQLSRRAVLRTTGLGAGLAVAATSGSASALTRTHESGHHGGAPHPDPGRVPTTTMATTLNLTNIQGNSLAGFNKDHQQLLFFTFPSSPSARRLLATLTDRVATCAQVIAFNDLYRHAAAAGHPKPKATWVNVALTHAGLAALGVPRAELGAFPAPFRQGMAARARLIGDTGPSAPTNWVINGASHGVMIMASDVPADLASVAASVRLAVEKAGGRVTFDQPGNARADEPGHEHFGFKDGVSQPGIRGVTTPNNPADPDQGDPGQDLLWPGEFVLGYPTQVPSGTEFNTTPGPISQSGPGWTADGSYLVIRRLRQDVPGFRTFVQDAATAAGVDPDLLGAQFVGRYRSGCPLEHTKDQPDGFDTHAADPSIADPSSLDADRINNFEFGDDAAGLVCPRSAHIRKSYPRDDTTPAGGEAAAQTHRILRRGIPFGESFRAGAPTASPAGPNPAFPSDRGLLFVCYQSSIERQFEFIQTRMVNDPDFPAPGSGPDPIITQNASGPFDIPGSPASGINLHGFVTTTGGDYFFQPSLNALHRLARV